MNEKKYTAPVCECHDVAAESLLCDSGNAGGERYGNGTDFGGIGKWEGMAW